jgi:hypothetical protein
MRNLFRQPLTWMVIAELVVVALLMVLVWNLVASTMAQQIGAAPIQAAGPPPKDSTSSQPELPEPAAPATRVQLPGLNVDAGFWRARLGQLNREQMGLEQLEWRIVHGAIDAAQRYLETVVLPAIVRAERASPPHRAGEVAGEAGGWGL